MGRRNSCRPRKCPVLERWMLVMLLVLFTFALSPCSGAGAAEGLDEALAFEDAVRMALAASLEVRTAKDALELARVKRDEAWETYVETLGRTYLGNGMYMSLPRGQDPAPAYYKADYDYQAAQKDYEVKVASVVAGVYQKYSAVVVAQKQVEAAKMNVALKERELAETEVKYKFGMESSISVVQKRSDLEIARSELAQAEERLNKAYADLAELLGIPPGSRPSLVSRVDFVPLEVEDVDKEIERIIEASPQVWKAKETVKLQRNTYGMVNSYDVDRINLRLAERAVDITKQQLYLSLIQVYTNVKALEENLKALEESLASAQEALRVARLRYELGMVTQSGVMSVEASVASLAAQMENLKWQHAMAVKSFYEPWAWSGSFGSTP